jgi:hypothetical protein
MAAEACSAATSLLPFLEPMLGASIAFNLAYLNLAKFGYITVVKDSIGGRLKRLDPSVKTKVKDTPWFKQMVALAGVDTLDQGLPNGSKRWIESPGIWGVLYNVLFYWRLGRGISILATVHALILLILGVGHASGTLSIFKCHFALGRFADDFWLAALGLVWPIAMVGIGTMVCSSASKFLKYQTKNLADEAKRDATTALDESSRAVDQTGALGAAAAPSEPAK